MKCVDQDSVINMYRKEDIIYRERQEAMALYMQEARQAYHSITAGSETWKKGDSAVLVYGVENHIHSELFLVELLRHEQVEVYASQGESLIK